MKKIFTLGAIALILFSCKKETPNSSLEGKAPGKLQTMVTMAAMDGNLEIIAKQLAASLRTKEMREFIKTEAQKKFDGDYNILYDTAKSKAIKGKSFQNHLATDRSTGSENSDLFNNINIISASLPLLNISVPANMEKWDTETFTPLVAIIASDYDEKTPKQIKAYDVNGKVHWLDPKKMPEVPVIAVGMNERSILNGQGKAELKKAYKASSTKNSFSPDKLMALLPPDDGGGGGGGGTTSICRINGQREYIDAITFPGNYLQQVYEDWVLGAPELRVKIFKPSNNFTTLGMFYEGFYEPASRSDVNDEWDHFYGTWGLFNWYNVDYGNIVIYKWVEEDSGTLINIPISHTFTTPLGSTTLSGTLNIHNDDDVMPTVPVDQRDCRSVKTYGDPTFQFELKHQ